MATNIKRYHTYIMEKGPYSEETGRSLDTMWPGKGITRRFMRFYLPDICTKPVWVFIHEQGYLGEVPYHSDELEKEFIESNGFLEQLELF